MLKIYRKQLCTLCMLLLVIITNDVLAQGNYTGITGIVNNGVGVPLAGVTVEAEHNNRAVGHAITDSLGKFRMTGLKPGRYNFNFSIIGYQAQTLSGTVLVSDKTTSVLITMVSLANNLNDVVVVGYGQQKKENLTGSVSQIKMEDVLGDRPVINTTSALQGAIPGLQITRSSTPGQNSNSLNIRGPLSINGGSPLVLIDNVPGDLGSLNPQDIETVTVLKDAASSAIYGARAAGGVILITTKHPAANAPFQVNYNNNFGSEKALGSPEQAPLEDYLTAYLDAGLSDKYWANSQSVTKWLEYYKAYQKNPGSFDLIGDGIYVDPDNDIYYLSDKNLWDNFLNKGFLQSHNISVSGGTDRIRYRISGGYNSENGPLITDKDFYKRLSATSYISADVNKWFTQELNVKYAQSTKRMPTDESGGLYSLRLVSYYPEGDMPASLLLNSDVDLPIFTPKNKILNSNSSTLITNTPSLSFKSIIKPLKNLEGIFEYTYNKTDHASSYYSGQWVYTTIQMAGTEVPSKDYYTKSRYYTDYNSFNAYLTYKKDLNNHHFKVMGGAAQESSYYQLVSDRAEEQALIDFPSFSGATGALALNDEYSEFSLRSLFYRINYSYKDKYLLELNGRYDGSSKFPENNRFGFFPSVSAGWQIAKEDFMESVRGVINELKLRASYGSIGNQDINPYAYTPAMAVAKSNVWAANQDRVTIIGTPDLVSDNFTWETVTSADIGLDFGFFRNRLSGVFDWYQRDTKNMLSAGSPLPAVVGAPAPLQNTADMRTRGFELSLNWRDKIGEVGYRIGLNLYNSNSWITKYNTNTSGLLSDYYVGQKWGDIWGYIADGYYSVNDFSDLNNWTLKDGIASIKGYNVKPGDVKFKNLMDDESSANMIDGGLSTLDNPGDRKVIGNSMPKYQYGGSLGIYYKGFDLNVLVQGIGKRDYWIAGQAIFPFAGSGANDAVFQPLYYNETDYWKPKSMDPSSPDYMVAENPGSKYYRIYDQMENVGSNTRVSNKYLQNASYLRIKNITLSYQVPKQLLKKAEIASLRFFVDVENLATFTSLPKGFDPESLSWSYPFYRTISFGLNVTF